MSKKANKILIGAFVVAAAAIAVGTVILYGAGTYFQERTRFVTFFEGSVKGLGIGAPVTFRGVPIGQVISIRVVYNPKDLSFWIPVIVELASDKIEAMEAITPEATRNNRGQGFVEKGLRAHLDIQSIVTGLLYVNLDFFPGKPFVFKKPEMPEIDIPYEEIPSIKTPLQEITDVIEEFPIRETVAQLTSTMKGIERIVNSDKLQEGVSDLGEAMAEIKVLIKNVSEEIGEISNSAQLTLADVRQLTNRAETTLAEAEKFMEELTEEVEPVAASAKSMMASTEKSLERASKTLQTAGKGIENLDSLQYRIGETLEEIRTAARSIRDLADYLEKNPESLLRGKSFR